jgi:hypothetical protein
MQATILARLAGGAGMPAPPLALRSCQLIRQGTAGDVARAPDAESAQWVSALSGCGDERDHAVARLHEALLRVARAELARRAGQLRISGPELDDLAFQAAADAVVAKVGQFRGESRFTTWAYRFVILEVSAKVGRHFWGQPHVPMDTGDWDQLPDRLGLGPRPQDRPGHRRTRHLSDRRRARHHRHRGPDQQPRHPTAQSLELPVSARGLRSAL